MKYQQIDDRFRSLRTELDKQVGARDSAQRRLDELNKELLDLNTRASDLETAVWLLQSYADDQQTALATRIEDIVTRGLQAVFQNQTLQFKLTYSQKKSGERKRTPEVAMSVWYEHEGVLVEGDLKNSFGGGLSVVVAVLLRIVVTLHLTPRVAPVIILDEPLRDLSPSYGAGNHADGYRERMADFLRTLVDETDMQIILVSHEPEYSRVANINHEFIGDIGSEISINTTNNAHSESNFLELNE